jgi:uncharacterized protein YfkK (UPF0435 family)
VYINNLTLKEHYDYENKMEPGVMDISINTYKNAVNVDVILNSNVDFTTTENLAEKYALIVKKYYKKRDIYLRIIQSKEELSSYSIKINKTNI